MVGYQYDLHDQNHHHVWLPSFSWPCYGKHHQYGHKWAFPGPGHQSNAFIVTLKIQPSLVGNQCQSETNHQALHAVLVWFSLSPLSTTMKRSPCWQVGLDLCSECCGSSPLVGLGVVGTSSPIGLDWEFGKYHVDIHLLLLVIDGRYTSLAILIPS